MKLKFGAIITEGVGKLGGHDFIRSRYGPNLRTRSLRTSKVSQSESRTKVIFRKTATAWRELTPAQRILWNDFAGNISFPSDFYGTVKLSGEQLFCQINSLYYNYDGIVWSSPPAFTSTVQSQLESSTVYGSGGPLILYWPDWVPVYSLIYVWATRPMSSGVTTKPKHFRYIGRLQTLDPSPADFYDRYISVFGTVGEPGSKILFKSLVFNAASGYTLIPTYPLKQMPVFWVADNSNERVLGYYKIPSNNFANADFVLCQPNFTTSTPGSDARISAIHTWALDHLFTSGNQAFRIDRNYQRLCIYNSIPYEYTAAPDICVGAPNFTTPLIPPINPPTSASLSYPKGACVSGGKLFIADTNNSRVLIWNTIPTVHNSPADVVLGQADFVSNLANRGGAASAATLNFPSSVFVYNNSLFITDLQNNRVLYFSSIPTINGVSATYVIGQPNFTSISVNQGGSPAINSMNNPYDTTVYQGRIYVGDRKNHRVMVWGSIPVSNNENAVLVFLQADFTSNLANRGGPPADNTGNQPSAPVFINGKMLILDKKNFRVLIFNSIPTVYGGHADTVIGQPNFFSNGRNVDNTVTRKGFNNPQRIFISQYSYPTPP